MTKLYYCIPTYKSFDLCARGIEAAMSGSIKPDQIIVIDNSGNGAGADYLYPLYEKYKGSLIIWPQTYNIGVAKAWNLFLKTIDQNYIIIANDDVAVHEHTLAHFKIVARQNKRAMLTAEGMLGNAYSLFLLPQAIYREIGEFDERFSPAYFEDNDYDYRRRLLGIDFISVTGATYSHDVSSTLKRYSPEEMNNHHNNFRRNQAYYISKWGGLPGNELYQESFGGEI